MLWACVSVCSSLWIRTNTFFIFILGSEWIAYKYISYIKVTFNFHLTRMMWQMLKEDVASVFSCNHFIITAVVILVSLLQCSLVFGVSAFDRLIHQFSIMHGFALCIILSIICYHVRYGYAFNVEREIKCFAHKPSLRVRVEMLSHQVSWPCLFRVCPQSTV